MSEHKTPVLVVTNDRWSRDSYVVFEGDQIIGGCINDEWVASAYNEARENDDEITRKQVAEDMESNFFIENDDVNEYWPEHHILRAGSAYYKYDDSGTCRYIDEDEALEIMPAVQELRVAAWRDEQNIIASAEITTPRQAGIMDRFGLDDSERNEIADDTTVLRKYNGRLYVYEGQLGDPAQWRLLQNAPHMPTGTLPRPTGA